MSLDGFFDHADAEMMDFEEMDPFNDDGIWDMAEFSKKKGKNKEDSESQEETEINTNEDSPETDPDESYDRSNEEDNAEMTEVEPSSTGEVNAPDEISSSDVTETESSSSEDSTSESETTSESAGKSSVSESSSDGTSDSTSSSESDSDDSHSDSSSSEETSEGSSDSEYSSDDTDSSEKTTDKTNTDEDSSDSRYNSDTSETESSDPWEVVDPPKESASDEVRENPTDLDWPKDVVDNGIKSHYGINWIKTLLPNTCTHFGFFTKQSETEANDNMYPIYQSSYLNNESSFKWLGN